MRNFIFCVFSFILLSSNNIFAGDLPPIYISKSNRLHLDSYSNNVEILRAEDFGSSNFFIADILKRGSSISFNQSGGPGMTNQLRLRGNEANHTLVLIDGIEANDAASGSEYDFAHLLSQNIDSIEIIKGGQSVIHGSDAIGGVINIKTKMGNSFNFTSGSNNSLLNNGSLFFSGKKFQYGANLTSYNTSGIDTSGTGGDQNRYENNTANIFLKSINHNFLIRYSNIYRQNDRDSSGNLADSTLANSKVKRLYSKYSYSKKIKKLSIEQNINYIKSENKDFGVLGLWDTTTKAEKTKLVTSVTLDFNEVFEFPYAPIGSVAFEYEKINFIQLGSNKDYGDPDQRQYQEDKALGFEYIQPYKYFQIEASVRKNFSQRFKNNDAYRLGLSIPIKNGKIFINKSLSIKNPTFTERFGYYAGTFYGNNNLVPEESKQYELGIQKIINNFNIKGSLYFSRLYNEINGFTYDSDLGGYTAKNKSSKSYRRGLDAAVTYLFNSSDKISLNYSYVSATEFDSNINKQVREIRRPRNIFTVNYVNKYYDGLLYTNTQLYYSSKIIDKDFSQYPARNVKIKDHFILNFNSDIKLSKNYTVSLYLKNITNKKYQETYGYKMPGFEAYINLNTNF